MNPGKVEAGNPVPIIIVNWNGLNDTLACVESVLKMPFDNFRVYIVDNGSDNDEGGKLQSRYRDNEKIEVIGLDSNVGFTRANLMAVERMLPSEPEYIALLNNDTEVDKYWLESLVKSARHHQADVLSSRIIYFYDHALMDNAGHRMLNTGEIIPIGHKQPFEKYEKGFENLGSCAAATLYSSKMILRIGFYDNFFDTGYEDAEYGLRAYIAGYRCYYEPEAVVYHKVGQSVGKIFNIDYAVQTQTAILYTYFKLMPVPVRLVNFPFMAIKLLAIILINAIFFRPKYIRIHLRSWRRIYRMRKDIREKRKEFLSSWRRRRSFQILRRQTFFLGHDIKRFWNVYIRRKKSAFDEYGF